MTQPNRTPEDELKIHFIDLPARKWIGPYDDVVISVSALEEWILADRKAQLTTMLEKGPVGQIPSEARESQIRGGWYKQGWNDADEQWRSIIKEVGGLDG